MSDFENTEANTVTAAPEAGDTTDTESGAVDAETIIDAEIVTPSGPSVQPMPEPTLAHLIDKFIAAAEKLVASMDHYSQLLAKAPSTATPAKRRGRPPGTKNKKKTTAKRKRR